MLQSLDFVDAGRRFTCTVEKAAPPRSDAWWWFRVSTGDHHRYAPFRRTTGDTPASVQARIVAYYDDLLLRRAAPAGSYWRRGAPKRGPTPE